MARMRIIKPSFYQNEVLAELPHQTRLYFIYLWMLCDKEGKMEFRPKKIKTELFPYEDADIVEMTRCLHGAGMVQVWCGQWEGEQVEFLLVKKFTKHQHPHKDEKAKGYPNLDESMVPAWCKHGASTPLTWDLEQGTGDLEHKQEGKTEKPQPLAETSQVDEVGQAPKYAFVGEVIKMTRADLRKWEDKFTAINVIEHLKGIDKTYASRKGTPDEIKGNKWFWSAFSALAKADNEKRLQRPQGEAWI